MAKVPLRVYNSDIEKMVEGGQTQEAIAHCRHILKIFPKHIDTYRLLGKAYLEGQRYAEAVDILQRVLSVLPDDFISHLGMSIIREDEGNLDAAIYHMEKAFEIQPASPAIQGELRRLYGRRDGVEPPRIRLNRGALVRMYTRGELYPQAIAETRAALQEDPQRTDLQVILARLFFLSGQKVQAVEIASQLVARLPYCYEANRILAEVLPGSARVEEAKVYRQRLEALDPYAALVTPAMPASADVPDVAVQVERLEYDAALDTSTSPGWAQTAGVTWEETAEERAPEWMSAGEESRPVNPVEAEAMPEETTPAAGADIPDWMAEAGWSPAAPGSETAPAPLEFEEDQVELASASEIPDWLKSLAPTPETGQETDEDKEWFAGLISDSETSSEKDLTRPEIALPTGQSDEETTAEPAAAASWLEDLQPTGDLITGLPAAESESLPDWLQNLAASEAMDASPVDGSLAPSAETAEVPEWPAAVESSPEITGLPEAGMEGLAEATDLPDWLKELAPAESVDEAIEIESNEIWALDETPVLDSPIFTEPVAGEDFEHAMVTSADGGVSEEPTAALQPEDDMEAALAWLEALAAKQGADEETLLTSSAERTQDMPDWLKQEAERETPLQPVETQPAAVENVAPVELLPVSPEPLPAETETLDGADMDAALAWLENLAARQGADEATLLVKPEERSETPPEWITQEKAGETTTAPEPVAEISPEAVETIKSFSDWAQDVPETEEAIPAFPGHDRDEIAGETTVLAEPGLENAQEQPAAPVFSAEIETGAGVEPSVFVGDQPAAAFAAVEDENAPAEAAASTEEAAAKTQPVRVAPAPESIPSVAAIEEITDVAPETPREELPLAEEDAQTETDDQGLPTWLSDLEQEPVASGEGAVEGLAGLPDWLKDLEETSLPAEKTLGELEPPAWIHEETASAPETLATAGLEAEPMGPLASQTDLPAEIEVEPEIEAAAEVERIDIPETRLVEEVEFETVITSLDENEPIRLEEAVEPAVMAESEPVIPEPIESTEDAASAQKLAAAQQALQKGNVEKAVAEYNEMIQSGEMLEEAIHDLRDATYRFPVDINIWQALGDAYMRSNRLQDALDAYTKAEELLR